jgi:hypothetical protein
MAKLAPEDKYCGIADASEIAKDHPDLQLDSDDTPEAGELERRGRIMEDAAMAMSRREADVTCRCIMGHKQFVGCGV